jgi:hypothetical protein
MDATVHAKHYLLRVGIGVAVVAMSVSGCANAPPRSEPAPGPLNTTAPSTSAALPAPDTGDVGVSVEVAQLPIGGSASDDTDIAGDQCVDVNWIVQQGAASIPDGVHITITAATFTPDIFSLADDGCSGTAPPCAGFTFQAGDQECVLAVAPNGDPFDTSGTAPVMSLSGKVTCDDPGSTTCATFLAAVGSNAQNTITLEFPDADGLRARDGDAVT